MDNEHIKHIDINEKIGFAGLGLIGGSIARAIHAASPETFINAYDPDPDSLKEAFEEGIIQKCSKSIGSDFDGCRFIFLCAPVATNIDNIKLLTPYLHGRTILTDVGSVKSPIYNAVCHAGLEDRFIGGHPMTGSEKTGYSNSDDSFLENAYYIMTPGSRVPDDDISLFSDLIRMMGAIPLVMKPDEHDRIVAAISHLPHIISASLVGLVKDSDDSDGRMKRIAAGGFKDITRISSSSPVMWQQICLANKDQIIDLLDRYISRLGTVRDYIKNEDESSLFRLFSEARTYRDSFSNVPSGPIKSTFVITADIEDRPGTIAAIASLLAMHGISIRDIGINHNRELAEGALRIEFYDEKAMTDAVDVLRGHGYSVHTF